MSTSATYESTSQREKTRQYLITKAIREARGLPPPESEARSDAGQPVLPDNRLLWRAWLEWRYPHVCTAPFAARHIRLWEWFDALAPGVKPRARLECWGRGGGKSTSVELGCARLCVKLSRRFVLIVCDTQDQADLHVAAVAHHLETLGIGRALNVYGHSRGWRRQELRTANGFNVAGLGLDAAVRGIKLDHYRPDLIVLDDVDNQADSSRTVERKIAALTTAILPAGSTDCAILGIQNKVHEESIFSRLCDGRADFLKDREPPYVEVAVEGLRIDAHEGVDGVHRWRIAEGVATWAGQDIATCERQLNEWGLSAFLREAQHEVEEADGYFFNTSALRFCRPEDVPDDVRRARGWDLAGTEGAGNWTVGVRIAVAGTLPDTRAYIEDVRRGQWSEDNVMAHIERAAEEDGSPAVALTLPQDPGQAGKGQGTRMIARFARFSPRVRSVTGPKPARAAAFAECVNKGNVWIVCDQPERGKDGLPDHMRAYIDVLRKFREDMAHEYDDDVDASADAYNEAAKPPRRRMQSAVSQA